MKLLSNKEVTGAAIFLDELCKYRLDEHKRLQKIVGRKAHDWKLFEKLLELDDPTEIKSTINQHWQKFWDETENKRFSLDSKIAYNDLKNMLKYHLYEKRDGGIINKIQTENGEIISNPK